MSFPTSSYVFRLVLSRFEFEGVSTGENALEAGEDEEEVWLFWRDSNKEVRSKSVRELAQDAKEGQKEDRDVLGYYRCVGLCTGPVMSSHETVHQKNKCVFQEFVECELSAILT